MKKVLVTGVFDILHQEHLKFLTKAKALGGELIVAIESDKRVRLLKGVGRPVNDQQKRKRALEKLKIIDQVIILPEAFNQPRERLKFLQKLRPQILAVSSHSPHLAEKARLMQQIGGKLMVVHQYNPAFSTTKIIQARLANGKNYVKN